MIRRASSVRETEKSCVQCTVLCGAPVAIIGTGPTSILSSASSPSWRRRRSFALAAADDDDALRRSATEPTPSAGSSWHWSWSNPPWAHPSHARRARRVHAPFTAISSSSTERLPSPSLSTILIRPFTWCAGNRRREDTKVVVAWSGHGANLLGSDILHPDGDQRGVEFHMVEFTTTYFNRLMIHFHCRTRGSCMHCASIITAQGALQRKNTREGR
jgi:hypothetical protein